MRLIDADRLSEAIYDNVPAPYEDACWAKENCLAKIEAAQTVDAVPVVRCRECKKHSEANGKHYCKFWKMYCPDDSDFFCKARKRKEGADNDT